MANCLPTGSGQYEVQFARATRSPKCHRPMTKFELKPYCTLCPASRFLDIGPWESLPRFKFPRAAEINRYVGHVVFVIVSSSICTLTPRSCCHGFLERLWA